MVRSIAVALVGLACTAEPTDLGQFADLGEPPETCSPGVDNAGVPQGAVEALQAVGDSILAHNKETASSVADAAAEALGVPLVHNATGGATVFDGGIPGQYEPGTHSHVLFTGGGNDFGTDCTLDLLDRLITEDLSDGLVVELADRVAADGAQLVIVGYYLPRDRDIGCPLIIELLTRYRALATSRDDVGFVCTLDAVQPEASELYDDPIHPSPAGAAAVGRAIADWFDASID
ncbi:MAG: SGNH/GDSL hydrolase family protein [Myxococcota bacterium]